MPVTRLRPAALALLALSAFAPGRADAGDIPEGTYISLDDFELNHQQVYARVWEYVEIAQNTSAEWTIETGFLHGRIDPVGQLELAASQASAASPEAPAFGRFDLLNGRRVALTGSLQIADAALSWVPDSFTMTTHAPGWIPVEAEPRPSPFLAATAEGGSALSYSVDENTLTVRDAAGHAHVYGLYDPAVHQVAGVIVEDLAGRVFTNEGCLWAMAADVVAGAPDALSAAALEATQTQVEAAGGDAAAAWRMIMERGPADVLRDYLAAQLDGRRYVARYLQALIDGDGGLDAMFMRYAQLYSVLDVAQSDAVTILDRYHYFDFSPEAGDQPWIRDVVANLEARHDADPWSLTGLDAIQQIAPDGWATQIRLALSEEMKLRCFDGE